MAAKLEGESDAAYFERLRIEARAEGLRRAGYVELGGKLYVVADLDAGLEQRPKDGWGGD